MATRVRSAATMGLLLGLAAPAAAQNNCPCPPPSPPPPAWTISLGGGMALTGGNTDTSSYNLAADIVYDPKQKNLFRFESLYLRASEDDVATVDRTLAVARDEYALGSRAFVFGQLAYQRDKFKRVDYLIAPTAGVGLKLADKPTLSASVDGGLGGAFEKLTGQDGTSNFALNASQRVEWRPRPTATLFERVAGLWKAEDFGDAYYHIELGVQTSLVGKLDLKLTFTDDYKTKPALPGLEKSDTSFIVSLLFKL
jgi:putative salt-induced outer membrane protein YdiY